MAHKLRDQIRALKQALTCPVCGKSMVVRATGWRGHGTGQVGASAYSATSFEAISAETHCTCPGGIAHHLVAKDKD